MVVSEWYGDLRVLYLIVQRDLPDVLACERLASQTAWSRKDFLDAFKDRSVVALVVEHEGDVVGFMVYRLVPDSVLVLKLAVLPDYQRMKIGTLTIQLNEIGGGGTNGVSNGFAVKEFKINQSVTASNWNVSDNVEVLIGAPTETLTNE